MPYSQRFLMVLAFCFIGCIGFIFVAPPQWLTYFISDDAYYYFLVAKNIIAGLGPTFDGYSLTNGFHPLWMLSILPLYHLADGNIEFGLRLVLALQVMIASLSLWLLWSIVTHWARARTAVFALVIFFILASPLILLFNGLESVLLICVSLLLIRVDQLYPLLRDGDTPRKRLVLGALFALFVLVRLDGVFFLFALAMLKLVNYEPRKSMLIRLVDLVRDYWLSVLVFLVLISPYFIWNYLTFGHLSPISGKLKSTFPEPMLEWHLSSHTYPYLAAFAVALLLIALEKVRKGGRLNELLGSWRSESCYLMPGVFFFGSCLHLVWTQMFMSWGVYQWHFVSYLPVLVLIYAYAFQCFSEKFGDSWGKLGLAAAGLILVSYTAVLSIDKGQHHHGRIQAAKWAGEHIPQGQGVLISDAGAFAYFSGVPTMNLDGLINSYEFQETIVNDQLFDYLKRHNIRYMADAFTLCDKGLSREFIKAYPGKNRKSSVGYRVERQLSDAAYIGEKTVHRPLSGAENICFVIWELNHIKHFRLN